jgi:hypothetical protein
MSEEKMGKMIRMGMCAALLAVLGVGAVAQIGFTPVQGAGLAGYSNWFKSYLGGADLKIGKEQKTALVKMTIETAPIGDTGMLSGVTAFDYVLSNRDSFSTKGQAVLYPTGVADQYYIFSFEQMASGTGIFAGKKGAFGLIGVITLRSDVQWTIYGVMSG